MFALDVEAQSYPDSTMPRRMFEYAARVMLAYQLMVRSVVIWLFKQRGRRVPRSPYQMYIDDDHIGFWKFTSGEGLRSCPCPPDAHIVEGQEGTMSETHHPTDDYMTIMEGLVDWLAEVYQERLSQAKGELISAETVLGGLGYEERTEQMVQDGTEHPMPQRSLARLANWFAEIERELEDRRRLVLKQQWESMAGEYALVSAQNLTEARQYLGLAQSALANLLVSLATNKLNAWEKQTKLYGVRLYLERLETAMVWAIESATNGLRQYQQDGGARRPSPPAAPAPEA